MGKCFVFDKSKNIFFHLFFFNRYLKNPKIKKLQYFFVGFVSDHQPKVLANARSAKRDLTQHITTKHKPTTNIKYETPPSLHSYFNIPLISPYLLNVYLYCWIYNFVPMNHNTIHQNTPRKYQIIVFYICSLRSQRRQYYFVVITAFYIQPAFFQLNYCNFWEIRGLGKCFVFDKSKNIFFDLFFFGRIYENPKIPKVAENCRKLQKILKHL